MTKREKLISYLESAFDNGLVGKNSAQRMFTQVIMILRPQKESS